MITKIGVIESVRCGYNGYDQCQIGFSFTLKSEQGTTIHEFIGGWGHITEDEIKNSTGCRWTHESRIKELGNCFWNFRNLLTDAKVKDIKQLVGKPVRIFFESEFGRNQGFEILKEAIL